MQLTQYIFLGIRVRHNLPFFYLTKQLHQASTCARGRSPLAEAGALPKHSVPRDEFELSWTRM
jgi:hypothetical protein